MVHPQFLKKNSSINCTYVKMLFFLIYINNTNKQRINLMQGKCNNILKSNSLKYNTFDWNWFSSVCIFYIDNNCRTHPTRSYSIFVLKINDLLLLLLFCRFHRYFNSAPWWNSVAGVRNIKQTYWVHYVTLRASASLER